MVIVTLFHHVMIHVSQIADFGMSRDLDDQDYYMSEGGMIPIKWTAPEVSNFRLNCFDKK